MLNQPKHRPDNRNLTLYYRDRYQPCFYPDQDIDVAVMTERGPVFEEYLDRTAVAFNNALDTYGRVLALRIDLNLPSGVSLPDDASHNSVIKRFVNSLNSQLEFARLRRHSPHHCRARYIAAREFCPSTGRLHFHVMLLLNGHAYYTLGTRGYEDSLYTRIVRAWASALGGIPLEVADPCVHVPWGEGQVYQYFFDRAANRDALDAAFYRASYLCKAQSKHFGDRHRGLMASRR